MDIIVHRVNTIERLKEIPTRYGVEIDVRGFGNHLFLNHDPLGADIGKYDELEAYLEQCKHKLVIFNMKEAGYEEKIHELAKKYNVENYFLLDVEFPYLFRATRNNLSRNMAVRFSEAEPIESLLAQMKGGEPLLDWVWIDTNTILPVTEKNMHVLNKFKSCLVCPERWGRPEDISTYKQRLNDLGFKLDAVMTAEKYIDLWEA